MKNKYIVRSRITERKFREIVKYFCMDFDAVRIAKLTGISRVSVNNYLMGIRRVIAAECEASARANIGTNGEVEVDESYFGPKRVRGKRGRGAGHKTIVFGLLKRKGKVYTEIVPDAKKATLQAIIRGKVSEDTVIHSDGWRGYDGLVDLGYQKHYRVHHGEDEFVRGKSHINGIESFWGVTKVRLAKRRGIKKEHFYLHLKECEFRFNHRNDNMYVIILKLVRKNPLNLS